MLNLKQDLWLFGLTQGKDMKFRSLGFSMAPTILPGDIVTIKAENKCRIGDIALYFLQNTLILHRVVANFSDKIVTKGDANNSLDQPIICQKILGKAIVLDRMGKVRSLDSFWSRFLGLAICLSISWIPKWCLLLAVKNRLGNKICA